MKRKDNKPGEKLHKRKIENKAQQPKKFIKITITIPEEEYPHFRKHLKSGHPAEITEEYSIDEYNYRKATHSKYDGRHLNEEISPNPNPADKKPMYLSKRVRHDKKTNFSKWKYPWKFPKK